MGLGALQIGRASRVSTSSPQFSGAPELFSMLAMPENSSGSAMLFSRDTTVALFPLMSCGSSAIVGFHNSAPNSTFWSGSVADVLLLLDSSIG